MIERNLIPAHDFWVLQPLEERKKILTSLKADETLANHDFAGLPPQVWAGIAAGLAPPSDKPPGRPQEAEEEETEKPHGRRR